MYLKYLKISKGSSIIRNIKFRNGINLIVDESEGKITGNSVGKTTVLKLIDFCFGANKKIIWQDPENKKQVNKLVKNYLIDNEILITLCLSENLEDDNSKEILIERNFISRGKKVIRNINGEWYKSNEFEEQLKKVLYPELYQEKPSFRQLISHNIRYKDLSLHNTLRTLSKFTSDAEYETLHLFMLGCEFSRGNQKQEVIEKIKHEKRYKNRLEKEHPKSECEATLSILEKEIKRLNVKKSKLNINENFEEDLSKLNNIKYQINRKSSEISKLKIRKDLILEAKKDLKEDRTDIDLQQLHNIYNQAKNNLENIQKSFEDLVEYHNKMLEEKEKFISNELPQIESKISRKKQTLDNLLKKEDKLTSVISKSDTYDELEKIISDLNEKHRIKGEYENIIEQINDVEKNLEEYNERLESINKEILSEEFELTVKHQLDKFNEYFSDVSELLYDEKYALKYEIVTNRKGHKIYKFSPFVPFGPNIATGKKQGEISSFDIAYTLFADDENIPCMHFILNDKKELMHGNQLVKIGNFVNKNRIQFVASILKDKLPGKLNNDKYFIIQLSEDNKLFKIENS